MNSPSLGDCSSLDHFASPASITDDLDVKASLGEKILFFENVSRRVPSPCLGPPLTPRPLTPLKDEDASFTSTDLDSISSDDESSRPGQSEPGSGLASGLRIGLGPVSPRVGQHSLGPVSRQGPNTSATPITPPSSPGLSPMTLPDSSNIKSLIDKFAAASLDSPSSASRLFSKLPTSSQLVQDFSRFPSRPSSLRVNPTINPVSSINSKNIYKNTLPLFSKLSILSSPVLFRGPGILLDSKPTVNISSSIITEIGIKYYITVNASPKSTWVLFKELNNPILEMDRVNRDDRELASFILSDIVTEVYKRSSYLLFDKKICLGKIIGKCLCVSIKGACLKAIRICRIERVEKKGMRLDGVELEFSCEDEREEWYKELFSQC